MTYLLQPICDGRKHGVMPSDNFTGLTLIFIDPNQLVNNVYVVSGGTKTEISAGHLIDAVIRLAIQMKE